MLATIVIILLYTFKMNNVVGLTPLLCFLDRGCVFVRVSEYQTVNPLMPETFMKLNFEM